MSSCCAPSLVRVALGAFPFSLLPLLAGALLLVTTPRFAGAQDVQSLLQQPGVAQMLRSRIQQSGLTADQIRARLQASGYPANLLDLYLTGTPEGGPEPDVRTLAAVTALGLTPLTGDSLPVDTGFIRWRSRDPVPHSRVFGVDVFRRTTTQFLPLLSGPVPADYRLGAGDVLVLILTGDVELAYTLSVTREGFVVIPQVGQVFVSNLTLEQLRNLLYARLGRVYSGVRRSVNATTLFDVSVANVRVNQVYVVGEVTQPGAYQISALGTALTALYAAGGVTERANTRTIEVQRLGKTVATLDLYDYLLRGHAGNDVRLETGDVVFVGVRGTRVDVSGAVIRPAIYELKARESLVDLLSAAGGFRPDAALRRLAVHRLLPAAARGPGAPPRAVIDVELTPVSSPARTPAGSGGEGAGNSGPALGGVVIPPLSLLDGDSVVVDAVNPLGRQPYVVISGVVEKPGRYPWREGMTLRDLVLLARGPAIGADLREAEIARLPTDRSGGQLAQGIRVPLDSSYLHRDAVGRYLGAAGVSFPAPGSAPEVVLEPFDNALIFRQPDFELQRTVFITGEVRYPGAYALRAKDERLVQLIGRAGGLTPQAYPEGIRFHRSVNGAGRINLDLPHAMRDAESRDNLILQPDDSIFIPEYLPSVKISGAVNSPGSVLYRRGENLEYYLSAAGGFAPNAAAKRVSVRFANGEIRTKSKWLFFTTSPTPGPGSEVFVPAKDPSDKTDYVALVGAVAQILASTVAIVVVATR